LGLQENVLPLFKTGKRLEEIKEVPFRLEKNMQTLVEENLAELLQLEFVKSELSIGKFRLDTIAFDTESKAFVIIEYKRDKSFSVIDQGYAYLSLMLNNKADFILEYNENSNKSLKRADVDWSQSRVVFISPMFTVYQREAINFKDLPIELWEINRYENQILSFEQIQKINATESVKTIAKNDASRQAVVKEIKVYSEEDHMGVSSAEVIELYKKYRDAIINLGSIVVKPKKAYIAFVSSTNVVDIVLQKQQIKIWINVSAGKLEDSKNVARNVSQIGHWGNGDYEISISGEDNFEYILSLIRQSLNINTK
jgi:predicted transport protein